MKKKNCISAKRLVIYAIYRKSMMFGKPVRIFKMAVPDQLEAEQWVNKLTATGSPWKKSEFMIEEMSATMNAWDGE